MPVRVPGRLPLYQVWFDIQPVSFEGAEKLEDLDIRPLTQARRCFMWNTPRPLTCMHISGLSAPPQTELSYRALLPLSVIAGQGVVVCTCRRKEGASQQRWTLVCGCKRTAPASLARSCMRWTSSTLPPCRAWPSTLWCAPVLDRTGMPRLGGGDKALRQICNPSSRESAEPATQESGVFCSARPIFTRSTQHMMFLRLPLRLCWAA